MREIKIFNEHLTKDHRGNIYCHHFKDCYDCDYKNSCPISEVKKND